VLHFLVTTDHAYTLRDYFAHWGAKLQDRVRIIPYEARPWSDPLPGTWIFTDLERLREDEARDAREFASRLAADPARWRVLNDPHKVKLRHALLSGLSAAGINDFRVFRLDEVPEDVRFPLFIRGENDHEGAISALLKDAGELRLARNGLSRTAGLLAVEYLDYQRADGFFVKYSMMRIGAEVVPRHVLFSHAWVLKNPDLVDDALMQEEDTFVRDSPHRAAISDVFQRAGIDYGRIDYTLVNGRIQVFEINTNPIVLLSIPELSPRRWASQVNSARLMNDAFLKADAGLPIPDPARVQSEHQRYRLRSRLLRARRKLGLGPAPRR